MAQTNAKPRRGIKEVIRKFFVSLKRSPQNIALVALVAAFLVYSLNLASIANTTTRINTSNMGQCEFGAMLFSILSFVIFLRCFPKRQKPKYVMVGLLILTLGLVLFTDIIYVLRIHQAINNPDDPIAITDFISTAQSVVSVHIILIAVSILLILLLPVYGKLLRKINTSIEVEGNESMGAIDISGED